ncbi:TPA: hypothetical protein UMV35_002716 [Stenotrophomonas maltophilia]|nr:hypothetical protein [Stenotrophomonas maltophilia]HEL3750413.1 hypothetical protein [Stenotrophomonas maltophilia]
MRCIMPASFKTHRVQLDVGGRGLGQLAAPILLVAIACEALRPQLSLALGGYRI